VVVLTGTPLDFYDEPAAVLPFAQRNGMAHERAMLVGGAYGTVDSDLETHWPEAGRPVETAAVLD